MKTKNLIIGGGFAGLYLASILDDAVIVEASPSIGGLLQDFRSPSGQFIFDVGGHVYTTKDPVLSDIMLSSNGNLFHQRKAFYDYQKKIPYPIQYHADEVGIKIVSNPRDSYQTFSDLLRSEFGNEFYEKVLGPFNRRVWSTDPSAMSADWISGRIPLMKDISPTWGPNSSFWYAMGKDIFEALLNRLTGVKIYTSTMVKSINFIDRSVYVDCNEPAVFRGIIEYENLFDTSGFVLYHNRVRFSSNEVISIGVGLNRQINEDFHWWYNSVNNKSPIHRITLLSRYHDRMAPNGCDSLLIEVPVGRNFFNDFTISKIAIAPMLRDAGFFFVEEKDIEEVSYLKTKGYPIPTIGHREIIANEREKLVQLGVYILGRWGAHGYYNLDHIIKDATYTKLCLLGLDDEDYYWANYYYKEERKSKNVSRI